MVRETYLGQRATLDSSGRAAYPYLLQKPKVAEMRSLRN